MGHSHDHHHGHHHHGHHHHHGDGKLSFAVFINILLTIAQIVGGIFSGSLSLIADALHNLSDAGAILIAIIARRIGNKKADNTMTYGYKRAEIIGVLINSTTLIIVGVYLIYEAVVRYFNPEPINGWIVFVVAGIAFVVDMATALITYSAGAKDNMNIRAAFIHNVSDAMASLVVIVAGLLIVYFEWYIVDVIATIGISIYVIYHGGLLLKKAIMIIMQAVPDHINLGELQSKIEKLDGVTSAAHIHIWQLDDKRLFMEAHIVVNSENHEGIKKNIRTLVHDDYEIKHTTLEIRPV